MNITWKIILKIIQFIIQLILEENSKEEAINKASAHFGCSVGTIRSFMK